MCVCCLSGCSKSSSVLLQQAGPELVVPGLQPLELRLGLLQRVVEHLAQRALAAPHLTLRISGPPAAAEPLGQHVEQQRHMLAHLRRTGTSSVAAVTAGEQGLPALPEQRQLADGARRGAALLLLADAEALARALLLGGVGGVALRLGRERPLPLRDALLRLLLREVLQPRLAHRQRALAAEQLGIIAALLVIIIWMFAVWGNEFSRDEFLLENDGVTRLCRSPGHCWLEIVNSLATGDVGDLLMNRPRTAKHPEWSRYFFVWMYQFLLFVVVVIILLNVVFGIIIDSTPSRFE